MRSLIAGAALLVLASGHPLDGWRPSALSVDLDRSTLADSLQLPVLEGDYDEGPALLHYGEPTPVEEDDGDLPAAPKTYRI